MLAVAQSIDTKYEPALRLLGRQSVFFLTEAYQGKKYVDLLELSF